MTGSACTIPLLDPSESSGDVVVPKSDRCFTHEWVWWDCGDFPGSFHLARAQLKQQVQTPSARLPVNGSVSESQRICRDLRTGSKPHSSRRRRRTSSHTCLTSRSGSALGSWTRLVPRPGEARVECGPTRRVDAASPMAQRISSAIRSVPWMPRLARRPCRVAGYALQRNRSRGGREA